MATGTGDKPSMDHKAPVPTVHSNLVGATPGHPPPQSLPSLGVDIGGFDTSIEAEIRSKSSSAGPPAHLPLSILTGQADGGFSLIHSNDLALSQEQMTGTWKTGC